MAGGLDELDLALIEPHQPVRLPRVFHQLYQPTLRLRERLHRPLQLLPGRHLLFGNLDGHLHPPQPVVDEHGPAVGEWREIAHQCRPFIGTGLSGRLIAPLLLELRRSLGDRFGLFSGVELAVDPSRGLKGVCDFFKEYYIDNPGKILGILDLFPPASRHGRERELSK